MKTLNEYQEAAARTADGDTTRRQLYGALGVAGEAGEVADLIKKQHFHGHDPDPMAVAKELGDVLWYVSVLAGAYGFTLEEIAAINIEKLRARYPDGFDEARSRSRDA